MLEQTRAEVSSKLISLTALSQRQSWERALPVHRYLCWWSGGLQASSRGYHYVSSGP